MSLKVGFSRLDVTPMSGIAMPGYYIDRFAQAVLDPLELNAVAFSCGDQKAVLITMDQEGLSRDCCLDFKTYISQETGISPDAVYLHATHTHTGPAVVKDSSVPAEQEYYQFLYRRMGDAARYALADLKPASMGCGIGTAPEMAYSRRFRMKNGDIETNPGRQNPQIQEPIGTPDHRVNVLRFDREGGTTIVIANFGNHPDVIGGEKISADWPGFTRRALEKARPDTNCIFFNGAQGDLNHINVQLSASDFNSGYAYAQHMGQVLADTIQQVVDKISCAPVNSLRFRKKTIRVAANLPDPKDLAAAHAIKELHDTGRDAEIPYSGMMLTTVVAEALRMVKLENGPHFFEMDLTAVAVGNVGFIGLPGEPFSEIGLALKTAPGWDLVLPTCITNGHHGYFPTENAFEEGGYEARSSEFQAGIAEQLILESKKILEEIR